VEARCSHEENRRKPTPPATERTPGVNLAAETYELDQDPKSNKETGERMSTPGANKQISGVDELKLARHAEHRALRNRSPDKKNHISTGA
jgi:hypothetical protein